MANDSYYDEDLTPEEIDLEYGDDDNSDDVISILSIASIWFIRMRASVSAASCGWISLARLSRRCKTTRPRFPSIFQISLQTMTGF